MMYEHYERKDLLKLSSKLFYMCGYKKHKIYQSKINTVTLYLPDLYLNHNLMKMRKSLNGKMLNKPTVLYEHSNDAVGKIELKIECSSENPYVIIIPEDPEQIQATSEKISSEFGGESSVSSDSESESDDSMSQKTAVLSESQSDYNPSHWVYIQSYPWDLIEALDNNDFPE